MDIIIAHSFIYLFSIFLFILGIKNLNHPKTAKKGNIYSITAMVIAVFNTVFQSNIQNHFIIFAGIIIGGVIGLITAKKVPMTAMPETVAIFNGFGGIASVLVAISEALRYIGIFTKSGTLLFTGISSMVIGTVTFVGSIIAFLKLSRILPSRPFLVMISKFINVSAVIGIFVSGYLLYGSINAEQILMIIIGIAVILGMTLVLPIGGGDMPVVISLLNSYSGIAVSMTGFVLGSNILIIVGTFVGASGIILTSIMCKSMNRSLANVLFGGFGSQSSSGGSVEQGTVKTTSVEELSILLDTAQNIVIVPGYGMATSQSQHIIQKIAENLEKEDKSVLFGIHPVAGRMPGHMNVILAEADVEYEKLLEMEKINPQFSNTELVIVVGANDVINPSAREDSDSPIYGMPILDVDNAQTVIVLKRSIGNPGYAGIDNKLFYKDNCMILLGDAKGNLEKLYSIISNN